MIANFDDAHAALRQFYGSTGPGPYTLDRIRALLKFLDNPQEKLQVVHVAGTSGKTSTAYYVAALLQQSGAKVGLTVSPHVDEVNERVQINLTPLPEKDFCAALGQFLQLVEQSGIQPSYFELMVAFAYYEFARRQVDYAVVEVGLGGLLDGTNVITRADKVCIITDIGFDHTEVLGDTLGEIAAQKAGIIQPGNQTFMYEQSAEVMASVHQALAAKNGAALQIVSPEPLPETHALPLFQQRNFTLAKAAVDYVLQRDDRPPLEAAQSATATTTYIPARMEIIRQDAHTLIIDGSHNAQKIGELLKSIRAKFGSQPITVLTAFVAGQDSRWQQALDVLLPETAELIITTFQSEQDVPKVAIAPDQIAQYCEGHHYTAYGIEPNPATAYAKLSASNTPLRLVVGSFYLLNDIRPLAGM